VQGVVVDDAGSPVPLARVWCVAPAVCGPEASVLGEAVSLPDGTFSVAGVRLPPGIPAELLRLFAYRAGHGLSWVAYDPRGIRLPLAPAARAVLHVLGPGGTPPAQWTVVPRRLRMLRDEWIPGDTAADLPAAVAAALTQTHDQGNGTTEVADLPALSEVTLTVGAADCAPAAVTVRPAALPSATEVLLAPGFRIEGVVQRPPAPNTTQAPATAPAVAPGLPATDETIPATPQPVAGAEVAAVCAGMAPVTTTTADDGSFAIEGLSVGRYWVYVGSSPLEDVAPAEPVSVPVYGLETPQANLLLQPSSWLAGRVTWADGEPVPGATVSAASPVAARGEVRWATTTGAEGTYALRLAPGPYTAAVVAPPLVREPGAVPCAPEGRPLAPLAERLVTLRAGADPAAVDFALDRPAELTGTVTDADGHPVPEAWLLAADLDLRSGFHSRHLVADGEGHFRLRGPFGPEPVRLWAAHGTDAGQSALLLAIPHPGGLAEALPLVAGAACRVSGYVVDVGGQPVAGADVRVGLTRAEGEARAATTFTDALGRFTAGPLWPGESYTVRAASEGMVLQHAESCFGRRGADVPVLPLVLVPAQGELSGQAVDVNDNPLAGVRVQVLDEAGLPLGEQVSDAAGAWLVPHLPEGRLRVEGFAPTYLAAHATVVLPRDEQVLLVMRPPPGEPPQMVVPLKPSLEGAGDFGLTLTELQRAAVTTESLESRPALGLVFDTQRHFGRPAGTLMDVTLPDQSSLEPLLTHGTPGRQVWLFELPPEGVDHLQSVVAREFRLEAVATQELVLPGTGDVAGWRRGAVTIVPPADWPPAQPPSPEAGAGPGDAAPTPPPSPAPDPATPPAGPARSEALLVLGYTPQDERGRPFVPRIVDVRAGDLPFGLREELLVDPPPDLVENLAEAAGCAPETLHIRVYRLEGPPEAAALFAPPTAAPPPGPAFSVVIIEQLARTLSARLDNIPLPPELLSGTPLPPDLTGQPGPEPVPAPATR